MKRIFENQAPIAPPTERESLVWRRLFLVAAIYNFAWGSFVVLFPEVPFRLAGMALPNYLSLFQGIGMMVMVFGYGYWLISRDPIRFGHYAWLGLAGKVLGPIGFVYACTKGELSLAFGINNIFNDVIWWVPFILFIKRFCPNPLAV